MTSVRQRLLWVLLAGLAIAFVILVARHGEGTVGSLSTGEFASFVYKIALLVFVGSAVVVMFRRRFAQALLAAVLWVVLALTLLIGYSYRFELRDVADRVHGASLFPATSSPRTHGRGRAHSAAIST